MWNNNNSALRTNMHNEKPVRVIRGHQGHTIWSPCEGFMYAGLYEVVACWIEAGTFLHPSSALAVVQLLMQVNPVSM